MTSSVSRDFFLSTLALVQERTKKLSEVSDFLRFFFVEDDQLIVRSELYSHAKMGTDAENAKESLTFSLSVFDAMKGDWNLENLKNTFMEAIKTSGYKNGFILYPLRVALSGEEFSPGTFELLEVFGKEKSKIRIASALSQLSSNT